VANLTFHNISFNFATAILKFTPSLSYHIVRKQIAKVTDTNRVKINALNKLFCKFNTDILAGCEMQADWLQATNEQQFRSIIGIGMGTRSVVAHNINERMKRNLHGSCAMMAMGWFSADVVETGVDHYGLERWCWMRVGSGDKKTRIVMAYQPSGSSSSHSAGTTVRVQHKRYFEA